MFTLLRPSADSLLLQSVRPQFDIRQGLRPDEPFKGDKTADEGTAEFLFIIIGISKGHRGTDEVGPSIPFRQGLHRIAEQATIPGKQTGNQLDGLRRLRIAHRTFFSSSRVTVAVPTFPTTIPAAWLAR